MSNGAPFTQWLAQKPRPTGLLLHYGFALVMVGLATLARFSVNPYLGDHNPYITYFLFNAVVFLYTGLGPSILALFLSGIMGEYLFLKPQYTFSLTVPSAIAYSVFVLSNLVILVLAQKMRAAKMQAEADSANLQKAKEDAERRLAERNKAEEALKKTETRHRSLFENMLDGCCYCQIIFDDKGKPADWLFLEVNASFERLIGLKHVVGKRATELIPDLKEIHPELFELSGRVSATGEGEKFEFEFLPRGIWLTVSGFSPAKGYFVAVIDNITERKAMIKALTEAKEKLRHHADTLEKTVASRTAKLQDSLEELEHFSYTLSHDLRSPLRAMRGFADLMVLSGCGECRNESSRDFLQRVIAGADRLDLLIHDALDYRQAASKEFPLVSVDVASLLRNMLTSYPNLQPMHAEISVEGEFPPVLGNESALTQCFSNLLGNAVKFMPEGVKPRIRIWAELKTGSAEQQTLRPPTPLVRIWVEDNGIGIAPEDQNKLFGIFQRMNPEYEGTGIGLALVRKNVEKMGGEVGVESELGQGSRFWIELNSAAHARTEQYLLPLKTG